MNSLLSVIFFVLFYYKICNGVEMCKFGQPIIIVVCIDGFRNEYFTRGVTPYLSDIRKNGASTKFLFTPNISNALATLHTVATGWSSFFHGVLGHRFSANGNADYIKYEAKLYGNETSKPHKPIWNLNEDFNGISACIMWPGCEFRYGTEKQMATYTMPYVSKTPLADRFKKAIEWLNQSSGQPNLIMIYLEEPDKTAHLKGPSHEDVNTKLGEIDTALKNFDDELIKLGLKKRINTIFFSDHSMWDIQGKQMKDVNSSMMGVQSGACKSEFEYFLDEVQFQFDNIYGVDKTKCPVESEFFASGRFRNDSREYMFGNEINFKYIGYWIYFFPKGKGAWRRGFELIRLNPANEEFNKDTIYGVHGYLGDNDAMFIAKGDLFISGTVKPFKMNDFYSLIAKALRIKGDFNRGGSFARVKPLFAIKEYEYINWQLHLLIILSCAISHCIAIYFYGNAVEAVLMKAKTAKKEKHKVKVQEKEQEKEDTVFPEISE